MRRCSPLTNLSLSMMDSGVSAQREESEVDVEQSFESLAQLSSPLVQGIDAEGVKGKLKWEWKKLKIKNQMRKR